MKMKLAYLIVSTLLLMGISQVKAQNTPQTVIIRMLETSTNTPPKIYVTDASGNTAQIKIDYLNYKAIDTAIPNNNVKLQNEINKFKIEGFKIDGISNYSIGAAATTLVIMSKD